MAESDPVSIWQELTTSKHPFAAIVKPTDNCNMTCTYCYVNRKPAIKPMTYDVLKATIKQIAYLIQGGRPIHFIWHGGEPLLLGRQFFIDAISLQKKYCDGIAYENCVQTNGTLLTREAIEFFATNNFSISLSIDGPADIHNLNRRFSNGQGSFDRVMRSVEMLKQHGLPVGAVVVMTRYIADNIKLIYDFMKQSGIQYRINPIVRSDSNQDSFNTLCVSPEEYGRAMQELFDLWFDDDDPVHIDPLNIIVGNMLQDNIWGCDYHGGCLRDIICVNPDGNLYPCGQMAGNDEFLIGNILRDSIATILASPIFGRVRQRSPELIEDCWGCKYIRICNAGCMVTAWMRGSGIMAPDYFCNGRKMLFAHIRNRIEAEVDRVAKICPSS